MKFNAPIVAAPLICLGLATSALAHHSNAMFDREQVQELAGTVTDYQWTNPHVWIEMEVPGKQGAAHATIEGPSVSILKSRGWKFDSLKAGDKVVVKVHPLRSGPPGGALISATTAEGHAIGLDGQVTQ